MTRIKVPKAISDPKYKGKHLLLVEGKVVASGDWKKVAKELHKVYKTGKTPMLTYIPKAESLILLSP